MAVKEALRPTRTKIVLALLLWLVGVVLQFTFVDYCLRDIPEMHATPIDCDHPALVALLLVISPLILQVLLLGATSSWVTNSYWPFWQVSQLVAVVLFALQAYLLSLIAVGMCSLIKRLVGRGRRG